MVKTLFTLALLGTVAYTQQTIDNESAADSTEDNIYEPALFQCTSTSNTAINDLTASELLMKYRDAYKYDEEMQEEILDRWTNMSNKQKKKSMYKFKEYTEHMKSSGKGRDSKDKRSKMDDREDMGDRTSWNMEGSEGMRDKTRHNKEDSTSWNMEHSEGKGDRTHNNKKGMKNRDKEAQEEDTTRWTREDKDSKENTGPRDGKSFMNKGRKLQDWMDRGKKETRSRGDSSTQTLTSTDEMIGSADRESRTRGDDMLDRSEEEGRSRGDEMYDRAERDGSSRGDDMYERAEDETRSRDWDYDEGDMIDRERTRKRMVERKEEVIRDFEARRQEGKQQKKMKKQMQRMRAQNDDEDAKTRRRKIAHCNPEGHGGWKTYQELSEVTLFHEDCGDNQCLSGVVFEWVCPTTGKAFTCAAGYAFENDEQSNFETMAVTNGENVTDILYEVDNNGQFSYFAVQTDSGIVEIGQSTDEIQTMLPDAKVLGLFVDTTEGLISDFGAYYQDSAACDCDNQSEVIKSNFREDMIAFKRDARQKVNAITDVGPDHVWNYCGLPKFNLDDSQPDWFTTDANKLLITKDELVEGIFTLNGTMSIGEFSEPGSIHAYINTLVDCEELTDGESAAREYLAWASIEHGIDGPWDLHQPGKRKMMKLVEKWWKNESGYLSMPKAAHEECEDFAEAWDAVIEEWAEMDFEEDYDLPDEVDEDPEDEN